MVDLFNRKGGVGESKAVGLAGKQGRRENENGDEISKAFGMAGKRGRQSEAAGPRGGQARTAGKPVGSVSSKLREEQGSRSGGNWQHERNHR